jgi:hypothetical protein
MLASVSDPKMKVLLIKLQVILMYFMHRIDKNAKYINLLSYLWNIKSDFYLMLINE